MKALFYYAAKTHCDVTLKETKKDDVILEETMDEEEIKVIHTFLHAETFQVQISRVHREFGGKSRTCV